MSKQRWCQITRFTATLMIVLVMQGTVMSPTTIASTLTCKTAGDKRADLTGTAEVNKVGSLLFPDDAIAEFLGDAMSVKTTGTKQPLLEAVILEAATSGGRTRRLLRGILWIQSGSQMHKLVGGTDKETVRLRGGSSYVGQIRKLDNAHINVSSDGEIHTLATAEVQRVESPRLLRFEIPIRVSSRSPQECTGDAGAMSFKHVGFYSYNPPQSADTSRLRRKVVLIIVAGALLATAITLPIVIPLATRSHAYKPRSQDIATVNAFNILTHPPAPLPVIQVPHSRGFTTGP